MQRNVLESDSKLFRLISSSCHSPDDDLNVGNVKPCFGTGDGSLEVLGQPAIAIEPCKGPLDHPSPWDDFEALCGVGTLDDFHSPVADFLERTT